MKVAFHTLGCKVNQNDTESLMTLFKEKGYEIVPFEPGADIYVINTCAVTQTGSGKSRQMIRKAIGFDPQVVVATGCYSQVSPEETANIDGINLIVGMAERPRIVELVEAYLAGQRNRLEIEITDDDGWIDLPHSNAFDRTRAMFKIEEGCEQFCSYCIIPYARGKVRSMPIDQVVAEFKKLLGFGYKEIVLTGIHLGSYGKEFKKTLADVLIELLQIEGDFRIRLGSIEPFDFDLRLMSEIITHPRVCQYLHIPLQNGSDRILQRMNRDYDLNYYQDLIQQLRERNPLIGIGTDLIVGFPGETEEDFESTYGFVEQQKFSRVHVFRYSARKGTPAAQMPNRVHKKVQEERSHRIIELASKMSHRFITQFLGKTVEVLFEERSGRGWSGLTGEYLRVEVDSKFDIKNSLCKVRITSIDQDILIGEME